MKIFILYLGFLSLFISGCKSDSVVMLNVDEINTLKVNQIGYFKLSRISGLNCCNYIFSDSMGLVKLVKDEVTSKEFLDGGQINEKYTFQAVKKGKTIFYLIDSSDGALTRKLTTGNKHDWDYKFIVEVK